MKVLGSIALAALAVLAAPSFALAHGPGPQGQFRNGTPPCATVTNGQAPCWGIPGAGPNGAGMPGSAYGHGPQMMQGYSMVPGQGHGWQDGRQRRPGWNWRN